MCACVRAVEPNAALRAEFTSLYSGVPVYETVEAMLNDDTHTDDVRVDGVWVCTGTALHAPVIQQAAARGKHVVRGVPVQCGAVA